MVKKLIHQHKPLIFQLTRFGIVGTVGTALQFVSVITLVEIAKINPLIANLIAFALTFFTSYMGHRFWTFKETTRRHAQSLPRYLLLALGGLGVAELLYYIVLYLLHLNYIVGLFIVVAIMASINFIVNKFWTFKNQRGQVPTCCM